MEHTHVQDFSLRILWSFARWIEDKKGAEALADVAAAGGVRTEDFDGTTRWVSHEQLERILAAGRDLAGSEEALRSAFAYRFEESYGAFRFMVWAVSLERMCAVACEMSNKVITKVSHFEILSSSRNSFSFRYTSERPESRNMCLSRQVAWTLCPTMRGLPAAELVEHACIAKGDACCEYDIRWFDERAIMPVLVGLAAGIVAAIGASRIDPSFATAIALPLLGAAVGYVRELRRAGRLNILLGQGTSKMMRSLGEAEAETRSEMAALQERQHDWSLRMEHQANDRTERLERIVEGLDGLQQSRATSIRGFSHDLRNPLFVLRANTDLLKVRYSKSDDQEILGDMDAASAQIETMLAKLMEVATAETGQVKLAEERVEVAPLADTFRRRLKALVHGRPIDVDVSMTDVPETIVVDPLVLDRVVDNLLTNAAKYTNRGHIRLVLGSSWEGGSSWLVFDLSDTGCGIPADQVKRIFRPRPASEPSNKPNSYGIGLSSAVGLLAQIGGHLEVRSEPDVGSTFTAYIPAAPPAAPKRTHDTIDAQISQVVKVRRAG